MFIDIAHVVLNQDLIGFRLVPNLQGGERVSAGCVPADHECHEHGDDPSEDPVNEIGPPFFACNHAASLPPAFTMASHLAVSADSDLAT